MQQSYDEGAGVYLVIDAWPSLPPDQYLSGESALASGHDGPFRAKLIVGINHGEIEYVDNWYLVTLDDAIFPARLSSVSAAVRANRMNSEYWPEKIFVNKGTGPIHHDLVDLDERTFLEIDDDGITARVQESYSHRPRMARDDYRAMISSLSDRYECHVRDITYSTVDGMTIEADQTPPDGYLLEGEDDVDPDYYANMAHVVDIVLEADDPHSRTGRLLQCGRAVSDYLSAIRGGVFDANTIVSLLRGGHVDLLIGQREGAHLDVKANLYNLDAPGNSGDRQKIELAQDVTRFANGDSDAVLVLGYTEKKVGKLSEVAQLSPCDLSRFSPEQYQAALDARIIPSVIGLLIEQIEVSPSSGVAFIYVPRQPEEMQPYLVHGAIAADKVEGSFFSIPQRRGEASINITASQIHGYIVAGKAFLRQMRSPE